MSVILRSNWIHWLRKVSLLLSLLIPGLIVAVRGGRLFLLSPFIFILALYICRYIGWWPESFYLPLLTCFVLAILVDIVLSVRVKDIRVSKKLRVYSVSIVLASWASIFFFKSILFGIELFLIPSGSMEPTLQVGDVVLVSTRKSKPKLNDIVVFTHKGLPESFYIKRVVATPQSKVLLQGDYLFVDKELLKDNIKNKRTKSWDLKDEQYFVMGDNTNHSIDSRYFGPIERGQVIGVYLMTLDLNKFVK